MYGSALAGEICLYTNRRGLYQSLLDLSVFSYVSYLCCVWGDHRSKCIHVEIYCMICMWLQCVDTALFHILMACVI